MSEEKDTFFQLVRSSGARYFSPVFRSIKLLTPKQRRTYLTLVALRVLTNFLDLAGLAGVFMLASLASAQIGGGQELSFFGFSLDVGDSSVYVAILVGILTLFLAKSVGATILLRVNLLFLARVEADLSYEILSYVFGGTAERVKKYSVAEIQWAVTGSTSMAVSNLLTSFNAFVTELTLFILVFVGFAIVDVLTAIFVTLYFFLLLAVFQLVVNRRLTRAGLSLANTSKEVASIILNMSRAFRELFVASRLGYFLDNFREARNLDARTFARVRFFDGAPRFFVETSLMLGVMALLVSQFFLESGEDAIATTSVVLMGGFRMMSALLPLQNAFTWIRVNGPQALDAHKILDEARLRLKTEGDNSLSPNTSENLSSQPCAEEADSPLGVALQNVNFKFEGAKSAAVRDVTFSVEPGSFVALVGPSGAGKSTLADLILGVLKPKSGLILLSQADGRALGADSTCTLSYVPQNPGIVSGSIGENVALGVPRNEISERRVMSLLGEVGLLEELNLDQGIFSSINANSEALSGGQAQRLGLARALYDKPRLIVLDEATSALDAGSEARIVNLLGQLRGKVTVIVVAHRLSTVQRADKVIVIDQGRLIGSGSFSEVRRTIPLIEEYVQLMSFEEP